jgi:hypothetical protein
MLDDLRLSLLESVGYEPDEDGASIEEGVIATIRRRWARVPAQRKTAALEALESGRESDEEIVGNIRIIEVMNVEFMKRVEENVRARKQIDLWSTSALTWCATVLVAEDLSGRNRPNE